MDKKKEQGLFWLPSDPEERVDGTVTMDDEGGTSLTIYGRLGPSWPDYDKQQVIQGVLADSHIKLVNCLAVNHRMNIGRLTEADETTWHCQFAFRGDDYSGDIPNRIKSVETVVELLDDWVSGFEGIKLDKDGASLSWATSQPDQSARWKLGEIAVHQDILHSLESSRFGIQNVTVRAQTSARISFDEPQSWKTAMHTVLNLQAVVSIAKGEAVRVERTSIAEEGTPDARLSASYHPVLHRGTRQLTHSELFTIAELGGMEGLAQLLNVLCDQESLITALLVDRYRQPAFITDRTGHLLIACEAYRRHRMEDPGKRIYNLGKEVLDPMLDRAGQPFVEWIGSPEDWKKKISEVRNNYGVGHLQSYAINSPMRPDFHLLNEQLYLLVVSCLLSECGVSVETRRQVVEHMRSEWKVRL